MNLLSYVCTEVCIMHTCVCGHTCMWYKDFLVTSLRGGKEKMVVCITIDAFYISTGSFDFISCIRLSAKSFIF